MTENNVDAHAGGTPPEAGVAQADAAVTGDAATDPSQLTDDELDQAGGDRGGYDPGPAPGISWEQMERWGIKRP